MKYLFLLSLCLGFVSGSSGPAAAEIFPITEEERAALVSGVVMGIDVANAAHGQGPMSKEKWLEFAHIFDDATKSCTDIRCVTDQIVRLRDSVFQKTLEKNKQFSPNGPEILR